MPELPEVEVVRRGLADHVLGARIGQVLVRDGRSLRRQLGGPTALVDYLTGLTIVDVARRGKFLWLLLSGSGEELRRPEGGWVSDQQLEALPLEDQALVIHLGMSGQVLVKDPALPQEKHQRVCLELEGPAGQKQLRFVDQRLFGGLFLSPLVPTFSAEGALQAASAVSRLGLPLIPEAVAHIARDPLDPFFDERAFRRAMLASSRPIKEFILNQRVISGVGNIYADEALWRARLHYGRPAKLVSAAQGRALLQASRQVMTQALAEGGTSFDALYVNVEGESGYFERSLQAYGREGEPCSRCQAAGRSSLVVREPFMNRSSYRCPFCQRLPRRGRGS